MNNENKDFADAAPAAANQSGSAAFDWFDNATPRDLRTRYRPKRDISPFFFSIIPWINIITLVAAFVFFTQSKALVPGIRVALPTQTFHDGMQNGLKIVAKNIPGSDDDAPASSPLQNGPAAAEDDGATLAPMRLTVFFNDTRFNLSQPYRIASFRNAVTDTIANGDTAAALVYMDADVSHGDAIRLTGILRDTGITNLCFVVKTK